MAAGTLPQPGSKYGPCLADCSHVDCAETRSMAASPCRICGKPIGYETRFYDGHERGLTHAICLELQAEQQRRQIREPPCQSK